MQKYPTEILSRRLERRRPTARTNQKKERGGEREEGGRECVCVRNVASRQVVEKGGRGVKTRIEGGDVDCVSESDSER